MKNSETETGTALVAINQTIEGPRMPLTISRPDASFVAQLIATAAGATQTRALRRVTQSDAIKDYGNVMARKIGPLRRIGDGVSLVA